MSKARTRLTTREKVRRTEQKQNDIYNKQNNTLIPENKSSEESDEEKITIPVTAIDGIFVKIYDHPRNMATYAHIS